MDILTLALLAAVLPASAQDTTLAVASPSGTLRLTFALKDGRPVYRLDRLNRPVLTESALGLTLRDGNLGPGRDPGADPRLHLTASATRDVDETWEQVWGEERFVRNRYRELSVMLEREARAGGGVQRLGIVFRVYDDGLGFRYQLPDTREMVVMDEATEFRFPTEPTAWWFAAYQDNRYEYLYQKTPLGQITVAHTPLTMETPEGLYLSLHEAALVDFPSMTLNRIGTISKIRKAGARLSQVHERQPNIEELAAELDVDVEKVREALQHTGRHLSMDAPFNDEDDNSLLDVLPDEEDTKPDETLIDESLKVDIERALSHLHEREAEITRLYFGIGREHPLTLEEIGQRFGLTRERVRQIKEKALRKLRQKHRREELQMHIG